MARFVTFVHLQESDSMFLLPAGLAMILAIGTSVWILSNRSAVVGDGWRVFKRPGVQGLLRFMQVLHLAVDAGGTF